MQQVPAIAGEILEHALPTTRQDVVLTYCAITGWRDGQKLDGIAQLAPGDFLVHVDHGIGISAEMLPRVFDLFAQADRTLDRSQGGLGIGQGLVVGTGLVEGESALDGGGGPRRGQGAQWLWLEVRQSNVRALQVYERYGFKQVSIRKDYYPAGRQQREHAVVMSLKL